MIYKTASQSLKSDISLTQVPKVKIKIVGIGGGGSSIVGEMIQSLKKVNFLIVDTDQRTFKKFPKRTKKFQFGEELTKGLGTGMNPKLAKIAVEKVEKKIKKIFQKDDLVFLVSCLGGGVGSGASPFFAKILKEQKKIGLGIFTLPFNFEGEKKLRIAKNALRELRKNLSGIIILSNEKIFQICEKKTPLKKAFSLMNQYLIDYLKDLIEIISTPGIINIDFADLKTILNGRGRMIYFAQTQAHGPNRVEEVLKNIFQNPFFIVPRPIKRILFNIRGGKDLALKEVEEIAQRIAELNPKAKIIFGISQNSKYTGKIKIVLLGGGESLKEEIKVSGGEKKNFKERKKKKRPEKEKKRKKKEGTKVITKFVTKKEIQSQTVRRTALEIKKAKELEKEKELAQQTQWEFPAFWRKRKKI